MTNTSPYGEKKVEAEGGNEEGEKNCGVCRWNCIEAPYRRLMYKLGRTVASCPIPFIVIPLVICLGLGTGMMKLEEANGGVFLYSPKDSRAQQEVDTLSQMFPVNYSGEFNPQATAGLINFASIIIEALDGNILTKSHLADALAIEEYATKEHKSPEGYTYQDLCGKWRDKCNPTSPLLELIRGRPEDIKNINLTNPVTVLPKGHRVYVAQTLGGKEVSADGTILKARFIILGLIVSDHSQEDAVSWLRSLDETLTEKGAPVELTSDIKVMSFSKDTLDREIAKAAGEVIPMFSIAITLIIVFAVVSCLMFDQVRSKPFVAVMGLVSAGLAILMTFGTLFYAGLPYTATVGVVPFLVLAVGVDGMFLFVSAWRHTSPYLPLEERVALTYREAAVSVTIASLTDCIAIVIGVISPFRAIIYFSAFATLAILMNFILQLTFFGGCFALLVRREQANRHSLICKKLLPPSQSEDKTGFAKLCCVGGVNRDEVDPRDNKEHMVNVFFGKHYAVWITKIPVILLFLLLYCAYLGGAVYGILQLKEGLELKSLFLDGSPYKELVSTYKTVVFDNNYMTVVIQEPLDYSSATQIQTVYRLHDKLMDSGYLNRNSSTMWFADFQRYLDSKAVVTATYSQYLDVLTHGFLSEPLYERYKTDLKLEYNEKNEAVAIPYSRFYLSVVAHEATTAEKDAMISIREIVDNSELDVFCSYPMWFYFEQYTKILPSTLQILGFGTAIVLVVCLIFLPIPLVAFLVLLSIASIEAGIIGYMTLWGVRLDITATLSLMVCTGFIVDFTAHFAYAYSQLPRPRLNNAMSLTAFPVLQSALSTVVGVAILSTSSSAISVTFFKVITITMAAGILHGILWLPVFLHIMSKCGCLFPEERKKKPKKPKKPKVIPETNGQQIVESHPESMGNGFHMEPETTAVKRKSSSRKNKKKREHNPQTDVPTIEVTPVEPDPFPKPQRPQRPRPASLDAYITSWNTEFKDYITPARKVLPRPTTTANASNGTIKSTYSNKSGNSQGQLVANSTGSTGSRRSASPLNVVHYNAAFDNTDEQPRDESSRQSRSPGDDSRASSRGRDYVDSRRSISPMAAESASRHSASYSNDGHDKLPKRSRTPEVEEQVHIPPPDYNDDAPSVQYSRHGSPSPSSRELEGEEDDSKREVRFASRERSKSPSELHYEGEKQGEQLLFTQL